MQRILSEYYRTVPSSAVVRSFEDRGKATGFFRFGTDVVCYGECSSGVSPNVQGSADFDALKTLSITDSVIHLPFDISEIVENLRKEHYLKQVGSVQNGFTQGPLLRHAYYFVRELLPVWLRRHLQRAYFKNWQSLPFPRWPVDFTVDSLHEAFLKVEMKALGCDKIPFIWFWPDGAPSCVILTHDVETAAGRDFTPSLMDIDHSHGFKASFQVVPEGRYKIPESLVREIRNRGFEFNIHDLNHDGHLFEEKTEFLRHAKQINEYAKTYNARGFRAGSMYRNQDWFDAFEFSYDMSVPNVAHLEPQRGGCCTVMPYFVGRILEIPLTTSQDYSIFHILNDYSIDLWKNQCDLIQRRHGLLSFITHPDYLINRRARGVYESLLAYLRQISERNGFWRTVPGEVDLWWRARSQMKLVEDNRRWRIEGPESHRARIAYAKLDGDQIAYTIEGASVGPT
jgi:peptidoglycan/xylan/chitin deacetylase (PgdA/CDA1 family)